MHALLLRTQTGCSQLQYRNVHIQCHLIKQQKCPYMDGKPTYYMKTLETMHTYGKVYNHYYCVLNKSIDKRGKAETSVNN